MKKPLHIIKTWFETGDIPTEQQFHDAFDSYHHKDNGELIVEKIVNEAGDLTVKFTDGEILTIEKFVPDVSKPMEYIDGLVNAINTITTNITTLQTGKVDKVDGKGLSDTNFSQAEKDKLANLENYIPPSSHSIAFIEGLQTALDTLTQGLALKVNEEDGKGLSSNDFSNEEKQKLADLNPVGFGKAVDSEGNSIVAIGQGDLLTFEGATIDEDNKKIIINSPTIAIKDSNDTTWFEIGDSLKFGEGLEIDYVNKSIKSSLKFYKQSKNVLLNTSELQAGKVDLLDDSFVVNELLRNYTVMELVVMLTFFIPTGNTITNTDFYFSIVNDLIRNPSFEYPLIDISIINFDPSKLYFLQGLVFSQKLYTLNMNGYRYTPQNIEINCLNGGVTTTHTVGNTFFDYPLSEAPNSTDTNKLRLNYRSSEFDIRAQTSIHIIY